MPLRVFHVVTLVDADRSYGGPLTVAVNQCTELRRRGHDARIVAGWRGPGAPPDAVEGVPAHLFPVVSRIPGMRFSGLHSASLQRWLGKNLPDVAHVHTARDLIPLLAARRFRRAGVPYVTQTHGMVVPDARAKARLIDAAATLPTLGGAATRFVLTDAEQEALGQLVDAPLTRLVNGVPEQPFAHDHHRGGVLFLGRLHPRKRVLDFARAASTLLDEGVDATFSVVGADDGELAGLTPYLREGLRYEGALAHPEALERLARAGVYVLPSVDEPFPMSLLEALALGVPSICTTSCGLAADLAGDGAALVVRPGVGPLTDAVRQVLKDPGNLSERARTTVEARYSMTTVGDALERTYADAVRGRLLWVGSIATPYRAPLWSALGERRPLTVGLLADAERNRQWQVELDESRYSVVRLRARKLMHSADATIYAPTRRLLGMLWSRPQAVVLDGWESPAFLAARWLARRRRVPVVAFYRSTPGTHRFHQGPVAALRRRFFAGCDVVLTAGPASTEAVLRMGIPRQRIVEGFNTVDVDRFRRRAAVTRVAADRGHRFLYVGQLIPRKNVPALVLAFAAAREPDDTLTLVGTGPESATLRTLVDELDLAESVTFRGHLDGDELVDAYAAADTFVLPSTQEVWGLVVNEALACGCHAVVSSACGITPSIDEMPGVTVTAPDTPSLTAALRRSRATWEGPLADHPITRQTPQELAAVVLDSVDRVSQRPRSGFPRGTTGDTALDHEHRDAVHGSGLA